MGVPYLVSFISKQVPNGVFEVDMKLEAESYRKKNNGKTPVIIIDSMLFHSHVYVNNHEILLGGRLNIFNERAHAMFKALKSTGADLIFFQDGPPPESKTETILDRRNYQYKRDAKIIDMINDGFDVTDPAKELPVLTEITTFFPNFVKIAEEYGELRTATLNECDQEIAYLGNKISALAVLTYDADFLIYEGDWHLWSSKDINFERMTTVEFNKSALREKLSLSQKQLSLLATLSGCDVLRHDQLKSFHRKILYRKDRKDKFCVLAEYIRGIRSIPPNLSPNDEKNIGNYVFHPRDRSQGMISLRDSVDTYCFNNMNLEEEDDVLKKIAGSSYLACAILNNENFVHTLTYTNLRNGNFYLYQVVSPLVRRLMGVLLQHEPSGSDLNRKHICKKSHETPFEAVIEEPRFPPFIAPRIPELINTKYGVDEEFDNKRWSVLRFLISNKLNKDIFLKIPKENFAVILTIFFLVEQNQITEDEADCLLLSCNCPKDIETTLRFDAVKILTGRDVELATFFQRVFSYISSCIFIAGLEEFINLLTFDGLYFHTLRKDYRSQNPPPSRVILNGFQNARIYSKEFGLLP